MTDKNAILTLPNPTAKELKDTAAFWFQQGLSIMPAITYWDDQKKKYGKQPATRWQQYTTTMQTQAEFDAINWHMTVQIPRTNPPQYKQVDGLAIITALPDKNGYYTSTIDYDPHNKSLEAQTYAKKILLDLGTTYPTLIEKTINNGTHYIYKSKKQGNWNQTYLDGAALELLDGKRCLVTYPTSGYTQYNRETPIAIINDLEEVFIELCQKHQVPLKEAVHKKLINTPVLVDHIDLPIRPCINAACQCDLTGTAGHAMRRTIATELLAAGIPPKEVAKVFAVQTDFNPDETAKQIHSLDSNKTTKCINILNYGYCLHPTNQTDCPWRINLRTTQQATKSTKTPETKPTLKISAGHHLKNVTFEAIQTPDGTIQYITYTHDKHPKLDTINDTYIDEKGITYHVPAKFHWFPCTGASDYGTVQTLYNDMYRYIYQHVQFPDTCFYHIAACFVLATWLWEKWDYYTQLSFISVISKGKTRALETLTQLVYRGMYDVTVTFALLKRRAHQYHITWLTDECQQINSRTKEDLYLACLARYIKGQTTSDCGNKDQNGNFEEADYDISGFSAYAGTRNFEKALASRCFNQAMRYKTRKLNTEIDKDTAQSLRNKLLMYRFSKLSLDVTIAKNDFREKAYNHYNSRICDLAALLYYVAPNVGVRKVILQYLKDLNDDLQAEEQNSFDSLIVQAIINGKYAEPSKIKAVKEFMSSNDLLYEVNQLLPLTEHTTSKIVGGIMKKFDFKPDQIGTKRGFIIKLRLLQQLCREYNIKDEAPPQEPKTEQSPLLSNPADQPPTPDTTSGLTPKIIDGSLIKATMTHSSPPLHHKYNRC